MENRPEFNYQSILESIQHCFDFLFKRGFRIVSVIFTGPGRENWRVTLTADDYLIEIYVYAEEVHVALSTLQLYEQVGLFELTDLIYLILGDEEVPDLQRESPLNEAQSFQKTARLLEKYIDEVLMEIDGIPILPSADDFLRDSEQKSGQLSKDNRPDFFSGWQTTYYSLTSPSITSSPLFD
jgi:hypothetical protein